MLLLRNALLDVGASQTAIAASMQLPKELLQLRLQGLHDILTGTLRGATKKARQLDPLYILNNARAIYNRIMGITLDSSSSGSDSQTNS